MPLNQMNLMKNIGYLIEKYTAITFA